MKLSLLVLALLLNTSQTVDVEDTVSGQPLNAQNEADPLGSTAEEDIATLGLDDLAKNNDDELYDAVEIKDTKDDLPKDDSIDITIPKDDKSNKVEPE